MEVKELIEKSGKTKTMVAKEVGISRQSLHNKLTSKDWSLQEAYRLAKSIGCTVEQIHEAIS